MRLAYEDWRYRSIAVIDIWIGGIWIVGLSWFELEKHVIGIALGLVFLVISKITKEQIGYGDSVVLILLGVSLELSEVIEVMTWAFSLCFLYGILYRVLLKKDSIPFIPFLAIGYIGGSIW